MDDLLNLISTNHYVLAVVVVVGSLIVARVVGLLMVRTLGVFVGKTESDLDDHLFEVVRMPIVATIVLLGMFFASYELSLSAPSSLYFKATLKTAGLLLWSRAGFVSTPLILKAVIDRANRQGLLQMLPLFEMTSKVIITSGAVYFVFLAWHIDVTAWLASAGVVGIAVGFGAKDSIANLFSGVFIIIDRPFQVGDMIVLDDGLRGTILSVGIRSTRVLTLDDVEITVPNGVIGNNRVVNETGGPSAAQRVGVVVDAAYGSDIDLVHRTLLEAAATLKNIETTPCPLVHFQAFGASGLTHRVYVWVRQPMDREQVLHDLHTAVYRHFTEADIEIPYSKHDVYIKELPAPLRTDISPG